MEKERGCDALNVDYQRIVLMFPMCVTKELCISYVCMHLLKMYTQGILKLISANTCFFLYIQQKRIYIYIYITGSPQVFKIESLSVQTKF